MSKSTDIKRVPLTSQLSAATTSVAASLPPAISSRFGADFAQDKPSSSNTANINRTTIRLELELGVSDTQTYPEFNFERLARLEKKKQKKVKPAKSNGVALDDPFGEDNNDDVERITKEMERKYGAAYTSGRKRKRNDECDIGMGYDDNDSFIDNTDAYDEIVPESLETAEGGFYVNSGPLSFKNLIKPSKTTKTDEIIKMPERPKKKSILSTSSEDSDSSSGSGSEKAVADNNADAEAEAEATEDDDDDDDEDEEDDDEDDEVQGDISEDDTAMPANAKSHKPTAKRHKSDNLNALHVAKKQKRMNKQNGENHNHHQLNQQLASSSNSPKPTTDEVNSDSDKERNKQKEITVKDMLKARRDIYIKRQEAGGECIEKPTYAAVVANGADDKSSSGDSSSDDDSDSSSDDSDTHSSQSSAKGQQQQQRPSTEPLQAENAPQRTNDVKLPDLDAHILVNIMQFLEMAHSKQSPDKKVQFDDKLSKTFNSLDESLRQIDKIKRNIVFAYMEQSLQLQKYYFLRKAKQLQAKSEKQKIQEALSRLRQKVISEMPATMQHYEQQLHKSMEQHALLDADEPPQLPRKTFLWSSETRKLLQELHQVLFSSFAVLGTRKETPEQYVDTFLREKAVHVWTNNFMRFEDLKAELEHKKKSSANKDNKLNKSKNKEVSEATAAKVGSISVVNPSLLMKPFDEVSMASRSTANSDCESVASSSKSLKSNLKSSLPKNKKKDKTQKAAMDLQMKQQLLLNMQKQHQQMLLTVNSNSNSNNNSTTMPMNLISPSKRTDHSISNLIYSNGNNSCNGNNNLLMTLNDMQHSTTVATAVAATANAAAAAAAAVTGAGSSNKPFAAHIINLDNYKTADDIIQTSQQLLMKNTALIGNSNSNNNGNNNSSIISPSLKSIYMQDAANRKQDITISKVTSAANANLKHHSGSESDSVEIVSVTPAPALSAAMAAAAKPKPTASKKQKKYGNKKTHTALLSTANSSPIVIDDFDAPDAAAATSQMYNISNNNNNNSSIATKGKKNIYNSNATNAATTESSKMIMSQQMADTMRLINEISNIQQPTRLNNAANPSLPRTGGGGRHSQ